MPLAWAAPRAEIISNLIGQHLPISDDRAKPRTATNWQRFGFAIACTAAGHGLNLYEALLSEP
jgi:hypothetical protein